MTTRTISGALLSFMLIAAPALAAEVTGTLGSPSATTTVSNKQLPAPDPKFGGVIKTDAGHGPNRQ